MITMLQAIMIVLLASNAHALEVFMNAEIIGSGRPVIRVKTNLPDTTKVVLTISNEECYLYQEVRAKVVSGMFEGGPFLHNGGSVPPGSYILNIDVELAQFQNDSVQAIIGGRGENLQGSLVSTGMLGRAVRYSTRFAVM
jgi:hypothetical protein